MSARPRVAWVLVVSCALVMVLVDGFLVVALRSVIGSIERSDHLFISWLRESLLLLPAYVVVVLTAVAWSQRADGRRRPRATARMLASIAVAGTLAGELWATASAGYDYRLQQHELLDMPSMQIACVGACPQQMQHAALVLQERALGLAAVALLLGNLLVVLWVYAMRGGVLVPPPRADLRRPRRLARPDRLADLRLVAAAGLVGAALIHLAVVPEHLTEWPLAGAFFVVLAVAELAGAGGLVVVRPSPVALLAVALLSLLPLALWVLSRTQGMPFGPEPGAPEAIGFADVAACALEVVTLVACLLALRRPAWQGRLAAGPYAIALALTSLLAVTAVGIGGSALPGFHAFGVAGHGVGEEQTSVPSTSLPGSLVPPSQLDQGSR